MSGPLTSPPADRWGERLQRRLGLWSAVAVLVGSTIGSGIFRTPASVAQRIDDLPLFLFAWAELWVIRPGAYGAIGITASAYTLRTLGLDPAAIVAALGPLEI